MKREWRTRYDIVSDATTFHCKNKQQVSNTQVARQCDPAKAHSNPITIHTVQAHSRRINSQSLCNLKYLQRLKSKLYFSFREIQREEKLKRDESYINLFVVLTKLFSKTDLKDIKMVL